MKFEKGNVNCNLYCGKWGVSYLYLMACSCSESCEAMLRCDNSLLGHELIVHITFWFDFMS